MPNGYTVVLQTVSIGKKQMVPVTIKESVRMTLQAAFNRRAHYMEKLCDEERTDTEIARICDSLGHCF